MHYICTYISFVVKKIVYLYFQFISILLNENECFFLTFLFVFCRIISDSTCRRSRRRLKSTRRSRRTLRRTRSACRRWCPWPESWRQRTTTTSSASRRAKTTSCGCGSISWSCSKPVGRGWR